MPELDSESLPRDVEVMRCDLCIVGAGIAGLNALFSASRYMSRDQKIILVDRRGRVGGMWVDTYSYVRLHQPHSMFTAGNIKWTSGKDRSYLATKDEVLDHLQYCLDTIKQRVQIDEFFGWEFETESEIGGLVRIACRSAGGVPAVVEAKRLIKAYGLDVTPNDPIAVSSAQIHSVSPDYCDIRAGEMRISDTPVWIIGGGKTAMDTAYTLITQYPGREVNLVAGPGTFFGTRDLFFPNGARRWWGGVSLARVATEMGRRFDGTNEAEVRSWFRDTYGNFVTPDAGNYMYGVLSQAENTTIAAGLNKVVMDYFTDAVDRNGKTELVLRSGATTMTPPGSWIVNCTGYMGLQDNRTYEPYISASGAVVSINVRSAVLHLPAYTGYFLAHLLFSGKIGRVPLYELDLQDLRRKSPEALPYTLFALVQHNLSLIYDAVPSRVFNENGLDFENWYPLARRLPGMARFMITHQRERERQRRVLDTVRERFDIRCGPLVTSGQDRTPPMRRPAGRQHNTVATRKD